ncbi:unnamed protein product [Paramecium sonneborni]|uniref:Uncharacterized protein n=1 Tax=Paramecium sonneborni TaxID=65129 RepID=A0A8S1QRD2_9CILI|nr:unnamed protein product [Paramecium sonneborni]
MESVKNQTVKIKIEPFNTWICKYCTFENLDGIICGTCSQYKEPEPQQLQYEFDPQIKINEAEKFCNHIQNNSIKSHLKIMIADSEQEVQFSISEFYK